MAEAINAKFNLKRQAGYANIEENPMQGNIEGRKLYEDVRSELHPSRKEEHDKSKYMKEILRDEEFIEHKSGSAEGERQGELDVLRFENPAMAKLAEEQFKNKEEMMKNYRSSYEGIQADQMKLEEQKKKLEQQIEYNKKYLEKIKTNRDKMSSPQKTVDLTAYKGAQGAPKKITDLTIDDLLMLIHGLKN
jgi:DNA repair exonuclease SbcCD ATPase subunit